MKNKFTLILLAIFLVFPASAAAPELDPVFCQALVKHVPNADVAYQAGVDVHGKSVIPADLPENGDFQLQPVAIPLTVDLLKTLNFPAENFPYNNMGRNDISLGTLTIDGDKVLYNGKALTGEQQDNLAVLCLNPMGEKPVNLVPMEIKK